MSISIIGGGSSGGGGANTGDITFSGVQIVGSGEDSGDGNGYGTIELVPDASRYAQDQYLVVDPTQPNHIHLRAGGTQDASNAELILGGEHAHVRVLDSGHEVNVTSSIGGPVTVSFGVSCDNGHLCGTYLPPGTTVEYNGVVYTVISYGIPNSCEETTEVFFSPGGYDPETNIPLFSDGSPITAIRPFIHKTWTFGNDGVLDLASGGLRFADNSTQSTAGVVSLNPDAGAIGSFTKTNNIVKLSQADYDTLTPDANTLYLIVD